MTNRDEEISRMRARHSLAARRENPGPVTGPWSFRELCEHEHGWRNVDEYWQQCTICWWCKPKLGTPPTIRVLPGLLKNHVLPPLTGKVDMHAVFRNAGFVLHDGHDSVLSIVRVRVVQRTFVEDPLIRRCGVDVKFKEHGWHMAAVFYETALYRLLDVLAKAEPRKPKALWTSIQEAFSKGWKRPWEQ